jgi:iron complex outermembrane receptor protein
MQSKRSVRKFRASRHGALAASTWVLLVAGHQAAMADQASQSDAARPEEIVVTAEKRNATVQKTPLSITAIKGTELQQAGITSLNAVAQQVPGVSIKSGGPGQTEFEMRGLNSAGGNSPTVGFYLDEVPLTSFAFATAGKVVIDPDLFDLSRVEVLRGPQGTLYGSGSMGGTIRLITNQPVLNEYHVSTELVGSGTEGGGLNGRGSLMVNLPIYQDKAALRIVVTDNWPTNGGLTRGNVLSAPVSRVDSDVNTEHLESVRASMLLKPIENLTIEPMVMGQSINSGGQTLVDNPPGNVEAHYQPFDTAEPITDRFFLAGLTIKYDFDDFQIVSSTSRWTRTLTQAQDGSEVLQDVLGLPSFYVPQGGIGYDPWTERDEVNELSQEIRVASTGTSRFQWLAGFYYGDVSSKTVQYSVDPAAGNLFGVTTLFHETVPQDFNQKSVFGEISYQITPKIKATIGLRYYNFDNTFATSEYGFFGPNGDNTASGSSSSASESGINPKFNIAWLPNPDLTIYATASKGFRPGGGNAIIPNGGTAEGEACGADLQALGKTANPATYGPDSVWNYELGEKARLLGGILTVNASGYYEEWSRIQRLVTLNCGYIYTDNAGAAEVYGAELEVSAHLPSGFEIDLNGGYTHAAYTQDSLEAAVVSGERLPDVPLFTTSQTVIYQRPLNDDYRLVARGTNDFIDSRTDDTYYINRLPTYDIVSARIGIVAAKGWSGFLFADNLTNKHALLDAINSQVLNIPTLTRDTTNQPRTFGLQLAYQF